MKTHKIGPLYAKASTGKIKEWTITAVEENDRVVLNTMTGYINGKKTTATKDIKGKNIGKRNETSPWEQALSDANSKANKKRDEGYFDTIQEAETTSVVLPMLALVYQDRKHNIEWPAYASPKLDGNRLMCRYNVEANIEYLSRKGKRFTTLEHLDNDIEELLAHLNMSDGELYIHGVSLQNIAAASKKKRDLTQELEYWIFDCIKPDLPFTERYKQIQNFFNKFSKEINEFGFRKAGKLVEVPNYEIKNEEELEEKHNLFVGLGFEGTMVRNKDGLYKIAHRSADLLKRKDFLEEEFEIIGGKEATGNDAGTVVFICKTKEGKTFDVRPRGTREQRKDWLNNIDKLVGKLLTVRYQYLSDQNIPCHLRGICIRDYE